LLDTSATGSEIGHGIVIDNQPPRVFINKA